MPLPTGMSLRSGGAKALGKTGLGGGGCWKVAVRVAGRGSSTGRGCWTGARKVLEGVPAFEGGFHQGSSQGFQRRKGFQLGFQQGFQRVLYHTFHFRPLSGYSRCLAATGTAG